MQQRMAELRTGCIQSDPKRHCFSLLHDAVLFTHHRLDDLTNHSLVGFIELAAQAVTARHVSLSALRRELVKLGFSIAPVN